MELTRVKTNEVFLAIMTGVEKSGHGPWEHYRLIASGKYGIPVVDLELRLMTEVLRDRKDRINSILKYLKKNGFNKEVMKRILSEK